MNCFCWLPNWGWGMLGGLVFIGICSFCAGQEAGTPAGDVVAGDVVAGDVAAGDVAAGDVAAGDVAADSGTVRAALDAHIHLRGGMTAEQAIRRTERTGIQSGVLENVGRDWPLANNELLDAFITQVEHARRDAQAAGNPAGNLLIGIQVNDRDWYKTIDLKLYRRLDFVLADTMIMGTDEQGHPIRLWLLPDEMPIDKDAWFNQYLRHTLTVLDEPVDILANPTWLPKFIAADYDHYWTEENMMKVIDKAVARGIALEIQAGSPFPSITFLKRAKAAGAKFSFGTNNFDANEVDTSRWSEAIQEAGLTESDFWYPSR